MISQYRTVFVVKIGDYQISAAFPCITKEMPSQFGNIIHKRIYVVFGVTMAEMHSYDLILIFHITVTSKWAR